MGYTKSAIDGKQEDLFNPARRENNKSLASN